PIALLQSLDLSKVTRAVAGHSLDPFPQRDLALQFGMEAGAVELAGSDALEQAQVGEPVRPVERHRFRRRRFVVMQMARPVLLVDGRKDGFLVRDHLTNAVAIYDLDVSQVRQHLEDRPLVRRGLPSESRLVQAGYC